MHNHWFTLRNYWQSANNRIMGARITQAFTAEKRQCSFILLQQDSRLRADFSGNPELPYLVLKDRLAIPRRKVMLFEKLHGMEIREVGMVPADRILQWRLSDNSLLSFEFFGGRPNIYHTDADGKILTSFKEYEDRSELNVREFPGIPYPLPDNLESQLEPHLQEHKRKSVRKALVLALPHWITDFSREVLARCGLDQNLHIPDMTAETQRALVSEIRDLYKELEEHTAYIRQGEKPAFSLYRFSFAGEDRWDISLDIEEAYAKYIGVFYRGRTLRQQLDRLQTQIGNRIERAQRRIEKQQDDLSDWEPPHTYRKFGDLLMANAHQLSQGPEEVELEDIIGENDLVTVPLNRELTPIENAQQYYEKAKRARRGREKLEAQIEKSRTELKELQNYFEALKSVTSLEELEEIRDAVEKFGITGRQDQSDRDQGERTPYTGYTSPDGWRILVGRSARDNDELTFHIAHKEDFWFHAENAPGSHVIAVPDNKNLEKPPPGTLKMAASLAAGHSQAKHSSLVPVVYTKRKYVTKPSNAGPGQVRYQFEDSVLVEPRRSGSRE